MRLNFLAVLVAALVVAGPVCARAEAPDISQFTSTNIQTLTMDSAVVTENQDALKKIGGDFAAAYRIHRVSISYVQPDKMQFESDVAGIRITYTINGNQKFTSVPTFHVHKVEDTTNAPGKKQSLLDVGLVPPELMNTYNATFLRKEGKLFVFQLMPKQEYETFKDIVWIDPVTHITSKRIHYDRYGKMVAWYTYTDPVQPRPGCYVPSKVTVYNPENELGGVTEYSNVKVNLPVDASIFDF